MMALQRLFSAAETERVYYPGAIRRPSPTVLPPARVLPIYGHESSRTQ